MLLSIIIPVKDENENLKRLLELMPYINKHDYEMIIADGNENQPPVETLLETNYRNIVILKNLYKYTPQGINLSLQKSTGKYIMLCGARSYVSVAYAETCIRILEEEPKIGCVGGRIIHHGRSGIGKAIARAMSIPGGMGIKSFRSMFLSGYVDTVSVPVFRKSLFDEIGLFDESLIRNQDDDISFRILQTGYKIFMTQEVWSDYFTREKYAQVAQQFYQYGFWKPFLLKKHKSLSSIRQIVPSLLYCVFITGLLLSCITNSFYPLIPLFFYWVVIGFVGFWAGRGTDVSSFKIILALLIMHSTYATGYLTGLFYAFITPQYQPHFSKKITR